MIKDEALKWGFCRTCLIKATVRLLRELKVLMLVFF